MLDPYYSGKDVHPPSTARLTCRALFVRTKASVEHLVDSRQKTRDSAQMSPVAIRLLIMSGYELLLRCQ